jgi:hypothetical protein
MQTYPPLLILLVVLALACAASHASERQIVLRDYINQAWTQELVTYSFSAKEGECRVDSVVLAGPNGPIPVQLSAVEYWPKSQYVKSAQLSFIADLAPTATNTYTLRWDTGYTYTPVYNFKEYKDLLHLQMPGDGAYFVAFFPRKRETPAPIFATLGNGTIIKISGAFGTDYGFLSLMPKGAVGEGAVFNGIAGSVQDRADGLMLCLGAKGEVNYQGYGLTADGAASLRVKADRLIVEVSAGAAHAHPALPQHVGAGQSSGGGEA